MTLLSIPGTRIVDPATGRAWPVHPDWPKCLWDSPEAKALHNARSTDPGAWAAIGEIERAPQFCNCEWCIATQGGIAFSDTYAAWLRAHQDARDTWPAAYWHRLYPALAHAVLPPKTEAEVFAA